MDLKAQLTTARSFLLLGAAATLLSLAGGVAAAQDVSGYLGPRMPYAKFDALPATTIKVDGAKLVVAFAPGDLGQQAEATVFTWVKESAQAITAYFGRFPVDRLRILVVPVPGNGNGIHGTTWGYRGAATRITLGKGASDADVIHSWVLTHEMVHVAQPQIAREHLWFAEGVATYIEPIARAQVGLVPVDCVWRQFLWGMPHGLPQPGDQGLDRTHTWGRTYWGGALFCLLADVEIREQTHGRYSLQDALRAVVAAGGNTETAWSFSHVIEVADTAVGAPVLRRLYDQMKAAPTEVDLDRLSQQLGVADLNGKIVFNDGAPLAQIRGSITTAMEPRR